jgi:ATP-binding cassette subfamily B protein
VAPHAFARVLRFARPYLPAVAAADVLRLGATAADLALLAALKSFIDHGLAPETAPSATARLLATALALAVAREAAAFAANRLASTAAAGLTGDLQNRVLSHLHGLSLDFFRTRAPGDLMARVFYNTERATNLVTGVAAHLVEVPLRIAGLFVLLWTLHPRLAAGIAAVLVPALVVGRLLARQLRRAHRRLGEDVSELYQSAHQSLGAIELLQTYGREAEAAAAFAARNRTLVDRYAALQRIQSAQGPATQLLRLLAVLAATWYAGGEIAAGRMTAGTFAAILVAAYAFLGAVDTLVGLYSIAQGGLASAERVFEILDAAPAIVSPPGAPAASFREAIRFDDIRFGYDPAAPLFRGLQLALRPGERVVIVGPSGGGKTTLTRLLLRLYDPQAGRVSFDGADARALDLASLRALFAVAPQDGFITELTIAENVALGRPQAARAEIDSVARQAGLGPLLARLPQGLDTRVGQGGVALSGGERQRVCLARAVLKDAPILVLDEATNALDQESEAEVLEWIDRAAAGRTLILIAHRLPAARLDAARTLRIAGGAAIEEGRRL